jgi:hypothetical protein
MYWRPDFIRDTDADTDGVKYIDIPADREYKLISLAATYERDSDITYTAALSPTIDIVTSSGAHGSSNETVLARYRSIATMTADTIANVAFFQGEIPAGDTNADVLINTNYLYIPIPEGLILSTSMRIKVYTTPSTGGQFAVFDLNAHVGVRGKGGYKA